jgi:hypothetical protein
MKLNDKMFPFIYMMFAVVYNVGIYFFLIVIMVIFAFSNVFWLLGRNVLEFDKVPENADCGDGR